MISLFRRLSIRAAYIGRNGAAAIVSTGVGGTVGTVVGVLVTEDME